MSNNVLPESHYIYTDTCAKFVCIPDEHIVDVTLLHVVRPVSASRLQYRPRPRRPSSSLFPLGWWADWPVVALLCVLKCFALLYSFFYTRWKFTDAAGDELGNELVYSFCCCPVDSSECAPSAFDSRTPRVRHRRK